MIGNTFAETCKLMNITREQFSNDTGVPLKTLGTWYKTKPKLMEKLFDSYSTTSSAELNNALSVIERLKVTIDTLTRIKNEEFKTYEPIKPIKPVEPIKPKFSDYTERRALSSLGIKPISIWPKVKNVCTAIAHDYPTYKYILLTLTVPNVPIDELPSKISEMAKAWKRLTLRKEFMKSIKGWFRTLEVTYNADRDDYHPHYHILLCVPSVYFKRNYITHPRWLELWQQAMRDDSITQVDVRTIKPNPKKEGSDAISSAAAEVGKYATKPSDYAVPKIVQDLAEVISGRKLVAFGGIMLEYSKKLDLQDVDSDSVR